MLLTVGSKSAVSTKEMYRLGNDNRSKGGIGRNREKYFIGLKLKMHQKINKNLLERVCARWVSCLSVFSALTSFVANPSPLVSQQIDMKSLGRSFPTDL